MNWLKKPSTTGGAVYLLVVAAAVTGVVIAGLGAWRSGCLVLAGAFGFAFVMRALLPEDRCGMLGIRSRMTDLLTLGGCAVLLVVLVLTLPEFHPR